MKKLIMAALILIPVLGWAQNNKFKIKGAFADKSINGKLYLTYYIDRNSLADSCSVKNGRFEITGKFDEPTTAYLQFNKNNEPRVRGKKSDRRTIYLEKNTIFINAIDSIKTAKITGSPINAQYEDFSNTYDFDSKEKYELYYALQDKLKQQKEIEKSIVDLNAKIAKNGEAKKSSLVQYIKQNPDSYFSPQAIELNIGEEVNIVEIQSLYNELTPAMRSSKKGKEMAALIVASKLAIVGNMAPEFTQLNTENKPVKLSDYRGKYVLVDFWASWCKPCREENPNVLKAYNAYSDKNFTVLGVSLDSKQARNSWLKAIKDDGMPWMQVIDPDNDIKGAGNLYGVRAIPSNFLIDPQGKIIGKNLRGEALQEKLAEVLK